MRSRDEILIEQLKRGERGAQRELYDRYSASLLAISMRYMGSRDRAEDALHDAFIKIFGSIKGFKYRGEGSIKAWMSRIMVNTALAELRQEKRLTTLNLDSLTSEVTEISESPPVNSIPSDLLLKFIAELPDGYRTVFNLFCVEELSHREIAKELGINEKSSSSQLLRAKRLLATRIKSYLKENE